MFKIKTAATVVLVALLGMGGNAFAGNSGPGTPTCQGSTCTDGGTDGGTGGVFNNNPTFNNKPTFNNNPTNTFKPTVNARGGNANAKALGVGLGVGIGKGGNATIERGAVQNRNVNDVRNKNVNNVDASNRNHNANIGFNKQGQAQGQGQDQGQSQKLVGGDQANEQSTTMNYNEAESMRYSGKYEVESMGTAYAPDIQATAGCRKPLSVGGSWLGGAFSAGTTFLDETCVQFENIRFGLTSQDPQTRELANEVLRGRLAEDLYEQLEDGKDVGSYDFEAMKADPTRAQNIRTTVKPDTSDSRDGWAQYQEMMGG